MSGFFDAALFETRLPARFAPILSHIDAFMHDVVAAREGDADAASRLRAAHDALMVEGHLMWPDPDAVDQASAEAAFVSGALRVAHYDQTVHRADLPVVDTAGSLTLSAFSGDLSAHSVEEIRAAVVRAFAPSEALLSAVDARISEETAQLELRHTLMAALDQGFPLTPGGDNRGTVDALFRAFYPEHPLHSGEVEVIRTATGLFFCIPYDGTRLTTRSEPDPAVTAFIGKLTHQHPSLSAHFPSFGSLRARDIPAPLLEQLAVVSGLSVEVVSETLPTMVVILPTGKVDQYIVHDAWGHGWQALLFRFEETYQRSAHYNRLPRLDERFTCLPGAPVEDISMREALAALPGSLEPWETFLQAATASRLYDTLGSLNAEVLADVVEYKFLAQNPEHVALMPSSSFVKEFPTKLDLTLLDMPAYYMRALQGFRRFAQTGGQIPGLIAALGGDPDEAARGLAAAAAHTEAWLSAVHGTWPASEADGEGLQVNTMSRVALNYLEMHALFNALYAELREADPQVRFADLLVFASAAFLEEDWARRFWLLDEFLVWFRELYGRFWAALTKADIS